MPFRAGIAGLVVALTVPLVPCAGPRICPFSLEPDDEGQIFGRMCGEPSSGCLVVYDYDYDVYEQLERMGTEAIPALIEGLGSRSEAIASACAALLVKLRTGGAASCLVPALDDLESCRIGPLEGDAATARARELLTRLADSTAGDPPDDEELRHRIGRVLVTMAHSETEGEIALRALLDRIGSESPAVRDSAVLALVNSYPAGEQLEDGSEGSTPDRPHWTGLLAAIVGTDPDWRVRWRALQSLGDFGLPNPDEPTIAALLTGARDEVAEVRREAVELMPRAGLDPERALVPLLVAAEDPVPLVRFHAIQAMGLIHLPADAVLPTLSRAMTDEDPAIRFVALRALGQLGPPQADPADVSALVHAGLHDESPDVRAVAGRVRARLARHLSTGVWPSSR